MHTATPMGSFTTRVMASGPTGGISPSIFVAHPPKYSNMKATSSMSSRASPMGLPLSTASISASRSRSLRTISAARKRMRPRSRSLVRGHHVPGRRVEHVEPLAVDRVDPRAVDVILEFVCHLGPHLPLRFELAFSVPRTRLRRARAVPFAVGPRRLLYEQRHELPEVLVGLGIVDHRGVRVLVLEDDRDDGLVPLVGDQEMESSEALG